MKKSIFSIITLIIFSFMLTACGGGGGGGGSAGTTNESTKKNDTGGGTDFVIGDAQKTDDLFGDGTVGEEITKEDARKASVGNGLAIFRNGNAVTPLSGPVLILTLNESDISGVTAYVNAKYEATTNGATTDKANIFTGTDMTEDVTTTLNVNKGTDFFGFESQEMTHLSWSNGDTIDGVMIAGAETVASTLTNLADITFTGRGSGVYGDKTENYKTIFAVNATVDIVAKTVTFSSSNTCKGAQICTVADTANWTPALDFSTGTEKLSFADANNNNATFNNISGAITAGELTGTVDARFYGSRAWEFGGIFSLVDAGNSYYFGAFGAERNNINTLAVTDPIALETLVSTDEIPSSVFGTPASFTVAIATNASIVMDGLAVYRDDTNDYSRAPNRIWGSADNEQTTKIVRVTNPDASIGIAGGNINNVDVHLLGKKYSTGTFTSTSNVMVSNIAINTGADDGATIATIEVDRSSDFFGFEADFMAYIGWHIAQKENDLDANDAVLTDSIYNKNGMMLAGVETVSILTTGNIKLQGKGHGVYGDVNESYKTIFDTNVDVNFGTKKITIGSSNTCKASDCSMTLNHLDFTTGALDYTDTDVMIADTTISGDVDTKDTNNKLAGTLDARFYGGIGQEFGGTFALIDSASDSYYYGIFGAERAINIDASIMNSSATVTSPATEVANSTYETITAGADANLGYTLKALSVYGKVTDTHTRLSTADLWKYSDIERSTTVTTVADARVAFTHSNKQLASLTLNPDNTINHASGTNIDADGYILEAPITSPPDYTSTVIEGYRGNEFFGFDSENMVYARWNLTQTAINLDERDVGEGATTDLTATSGISNGVMIAGLETVNITNTGSAKFIGKGHGFYSNADTNIDYQTSFRVRADVNFGDSKVTINSYDTCKASDCANAPVSALDFSTDALSYTDADTALADTTISGSVTADDLTGTLDARFYGTATSEFGGTFAMLGTDNGVTNESYYGAFGAVEKEFHIVADTVAFPKWSDTTTRTMNGLGYTIAASDGPLTQTFNITQTGGQISAVIINTLNVAGATSNTQTFAQSLKDGNYGHISDDTANIETTVFSSHKGVMRFIHKDNTNATGNRITVVHEPDSNKPWSWEYQTVGIIDDGTAKGGFSTGAFTNDIPTSGTPSFSGSAYGYYDDNGTGYLTRATVTVAVNFAAGTAEITTTATKRITPPSVGVVGGNNTFSGQSFGRSSGDDSSLDFTGTLRYQELYKWFRGDVTATLGTGDATMKAYGPNAEEVGGVFRLQNSAGTKVYAGAFGAK
ncbi:MAG: transferrin-binding protein-like solute binding protein [Alphaproteobacteria bacterium]|nr:transferrin-binding protein-like solute binding protein [Alphaproteobacteria bacterium]